MQFSLATVVVVLVWGFPGTSWPALPGLCFKTWCLCFECLGLGLMWARERCRISPPCVGVSTDLFRWHGIVSEDVVVVSGDVLWQSCRTTTTLSTTALTSSYTSVLQTWQTRTRPTTSTRSRLVCLRTSACCHMLPAYRCTVSSVCQWVLIWDKWLWYYIADICYIWVCVTCSHELWSYAVVTWTIH